MELHRLTHTRRPRRTLHVQVAQSQKKQPLRKQLVRTLVQPPRQNCQVIPTSIQETRRQRLEHHLATTLLLQLQCQQNLQMSQAMSGTLELLFEPKVKEGAMV